VVKKKYVVLFPDRKHKSLEREGECEATKENVKPDEHKLEEHISSM